MKSIFFLASTLLCTAINEKANPIGQVLDLLQKLYDTVVADGVTEQKQFEAFSEWCEDQARERGNEIETGSAQVEDLNAAIEKSAANISVLKSRFEEISGVVAANTGDLKAATEIREKEHATFKKEEAELEDTVSTLRRAQQVLSRQLQKGGSFAQSPQAFQELTNSLGVIMNASMFSIEDTNKLKSFLQSEEEFRNEEEEEGVDAPAVRAYESHSGSIMDILEDMQEKAEGMLSEARKTEVNARHTNELLAQSLNNELKVQNEDLSTTKLHLSDANESKATAEGDLAVTAKGLEEDKVYLKELTANCQQRAQDSEISQKSRAEEIKALAEARKIIEEATGGSSKRQYSSFFQVGAKNGEVFDQVETSIKKLGKRDGNFLLTQLAGQIRAAVTMSKDPFAKVKQLIRDMVTRLIVEAQEEASHKAFCDKETADNEAKRDKLQAETNKLNTRIEKATVGAATLKGEIAELQAAIANIAKSQKEIDAFRSSEHEEFVKAKADFEQGLDGIRSALRILRDYYQKQGTTTALLQQQPFTSTHSQATDSATGIIGILEVAESDFARSLAESTAGEDDAQEAYNKTTQENKVSTATKRTGVEGKTQEVQRLEQQLGNATSDRNGVQEELSAVLDYLEKLRPQCTVKVESYESRTARREQEIEGLKQALNILENELAFMQQKPSFLAVKRSQLTIQ